MVLFEKEITAGPTAQLTIIASTSPEHNAMEPKYKATLNTDGTYDVVSINDGKPSPLIPLVASMLKASGHDEHPIAYIYIFS